MQMSFRSDLPDHFDLAVDHGHLGAHCDAVMNHPALFDITHPQHMRAKGEVEAAFDAMFGTAPLDGGQPHDVMTFTTEASKT